MSDPYATHIPVLRMLSERVPMRRVLEFGAGRYSTPFFLSLPDLERLVSVETDTYWRRRVQSDDPRHEVVTDPPGLDGFDFVLVDDGATKVERLRTICRVLGGDHPVVAVHDAEVPEYADAINELANGKVAVVAELTPHTAVVWP